VGVSSTCGDSDVALASGLRNVGSFDPLAEPGVTEETDLWVMGLLFEYGLGVVRLRGLKLWPVSIPEVLVDPFHLGRWAKVDPGRSILLP